MNINKNRVFLAISLSIIGVAAVASSVTVPYTFESGTPAVASEVNAVINTIAASVNDNHARIAQLEQENAALVKAIANYDNDSDTYTIGDGDCDDSDYDINPGVSNDAPNDGIDNDCNGVIDDGSPVYAIGDTGPAGGIVFYVSNGGQDGFEAALDDAEGGSSDIGWGCPTTSIQGAAGVVIGTGAANTAAIVAGCADTGIAAKLANDFSFGGFDDWFLPSLDELNELYNQKDVVGGFGEDLYWTSTERSATNAWYQFFRMNNDGMQGSSGTKTEVFIRARFIRAI